MRLLVLVCLVAACANAQPSTELEVSTDAVTLAAGRSEVVMVIGDPSPSDAWTSDHPNIAKVTAGENGEATIQGLALGHAIIVATRGPIARSIDVTVTAAELDLLEVTSTRTVVPRGLTIQLVATGTFSDQHTEDLSGTVAWTSTDMTVATVDPTGLLNANAVGAAAITATSAAVVGMFAVTISDAELSSMTLNSAGGPLAKGLTVQLSVTGVFSDNSTDDITDLVAWSTTNDAIASVDHGGLVLAVAAAGTATITATADQLHADTSVTVGPAILVAIEIGPAPLSLALGVDQPLVATGTYSDATTTNVTPNAAWSVTSGTALTVTTGGLAHAAAQGTATVRAIVGTVTGTLVGSVGPAIADHLELSTGDLGLTKSQRVQLRATLVYTDGARPNVTASATWSSSGTSATVASGLITATTTAGPTTITVSTGGQTASIVATVGAATCHLVINEVQAGGASAGDEWVELYNPCTATVDVTGWTLVYRAASTIGATDTNNLQTLTGSLAPGDLRLYVGPTYAGAGTPDGTAWGGGTGLVGATNGAIGLRSGPKDTGPLVDSVAYGTITAGHPFLETTAAPALSASKSIARLPFDGNDTNSGANFTLIATPSPRSLNAP